MEEALSEREKYGMDAMPIAGGQSLLVLLRNKLIDPKILIDLETLDELHGLQRKSSGVSIGAMTTIFRLASSADVQRRLRCLAQAACQGRLDGDQESGHDRRQPLSQRARRGPAAGAAGC